jgi:hypothetical protein
MARGWESKSVESQMEEAAEARREASQKKAVSAVDAERMRQREGLMLHRKRVLHDIETAQNARYRETLQAALKHLDEKLLELP